MGYHYIRYDSYFLISMAARQDGAEVIRYFRVYSWHKDLSVRNISATPDVWGSCQRVLDLVREIDRTSSGRIEIYEDWDHSIDNLIYTTDTIERYPYDEEWPWGDF